MTPPDDTVAEDLHEPDEAYCSTCNKSFSADTTLCPDDGAKLIRLSAERDDVIGLVLDNRYQIKAPLGKGGMGTVYRGVQLSVDREVAIKVIHPKLASDRASVKRFLREAKLATRLNQPSIVNVYDFGQSDRLLFLVMELLRGHTLASELGNGRRLNLRRTAIIGGQLCDALEAAHAQDIVHRDLKPSNIVILDDPPGRDLIKVLDFGLAKSLVQDSGSHITNPDAILGTPLYMAPEQIEGKVSDQRADLYSLGCILYEMVSGAPPFSEHVVSAVLARHLTEDPPPLPSHVPARLRLLIENLLAKAPEQRVQAAGDVRAVLEQVLQSGGLVTPASLDVPDTMPDLQRALAETVSVEPVAAQTMSGTRTSRRWLLAALAAVALAGIAFAVVSLAGGSAHPQPDAQATAPVTATPDAASVPIDAAIAPIDAPVDAAIPIDAAVKPHGHTQPKPPKPPKQDDPTMEFIQPKKGS